MTPEFFKHLASVIASLSCVIASLSSVIASEAWQSRTSWIATGFALAMTSP
jgi:hypothetical protein